MVGYRWGISTAKDGVSNPRLARYHARQHGSVRGAAGNRWRIIGVKISPSGTRSRFRSDIIIRSCPLNKRRHFHESATNRQLGWRGRRSTGPAAQSRLLHDQNRSFLRVARDSLRASILSDKPVFRPELLIRRLNLVGGPPTRSESEWPKLGRVIGSARRPAANSYP